ncbi:Epstein-Barr virus EBNA-1-like protein [Burkholderia pseudomallei MSHR1043]|uniref:Epstein-Barr virus EBNA-1-like protein n=1 Tax=Burkholderia pseudomallei (strain 1710b) TaxID=320372 RepID=Q3JS15_BURP1|nr:Epstein-Barr virus EBNA-1-like protein [Burkholderia pseudomallei 1710b]EMP77367.1 Epstein-Barr virus EBNA-1-like protein [Burkholderia pseudomallei MSHR1043]
MIVAARRPRDAALHGEAPAARLGIGDHVIGDAQARDAHQQMRAVGERGDIVVVCEAHRRAARESLRAARRARGRRGRLAGVDAARRARPDVAVALERLVCARRVMRRHPLVRRQIRDRDARAARAVIGPAVIAALQPALGRDAPERQRRAAMRAAVFHRAHGAGRVAKQHDRLPHAHHGERGLAAHLFGQRERQPACGGIGKKRNDGIHGYSSRRARCLRQSWQTGIAACRLSLRRAKSRRRVARARRRRAQRAALREPMGRHRAQPRHRQRRDQQDRVQRSGNDPQLQADREHHQLDRAAAVHQHAHERRLRAVDAAQSRARVAAGEFRRHAADEKRGEPAPGRARVERGERCLKAHADEEERNQHEIGEAGEARVPQLAQVVAPREVGGRDERAERAVKAEPRRGPRRQQHVAERADQHGGAAAGPARSIEHAEHDGAHERDRHDDERDEHAHRVHRRGGRQARGRERADGREHQPAERIGQRRREYR